ncbi:VCBS repeat-containing protein [Flagellimonas flava]|uniref:Repeat domain-containing protein n=1 Tax=Flagellimonas flava TaxID=570519 RepID=A0A1M5KAU3_9FLAO|nr:VCBS repeat-containing protein [Allomuricauda flava]SHG49887.1 Repeat domain-containing protein [Allomuricauda flava]
MRGLFWVVMGILFFGVSCSKNKPKTLFKTISSNHSGITFVNQLTPTPELNILNYLYYYNGAGVVAGDFNNDGLQDLYFTSNQGADKLYLNQGDFRFKDITNISGIDNISGWTTGATHIDINHDGLLDIYICKVGGYRELEGKNLLFINQGIDGDGVPSFIEEASKYNLDYSGFSTKAAFFDYDLDGDLDMYLLNHSVNPNRSYGRGSKRESFDKQSGDILFRNSGGYFEDVSQDAGIFQGTIGYGLGLSISDINSDGYPDIYVGNDFFENDYLYLNQGDGTFKELISESQNRLGHTSHYSMGNDIADINNDGLTDIVSLDMLPENLESYKTSGLEYPYPIYQQYLKNGFAPQFMQNTLHLNANGDNFSEIAHMSGINATEWSWGALLQDFDNDGLKDVFISNGIRGATNDMDFISFIANEKIQKQLEGGMTKKEMAFITEIPEKKVPNYFYKNNGDLTFSDVTQSWLTKEGSFSNGCAYVDLDNDGDLDIVVNNVDQEAYVLENTLDKSSKNHSLQIRLQGARQNPNGIGVKAIAYTKQGTIAVENFVSKGYLSAVPHTVHLGIGKDSILDSLKIVWPNGKYQVLPNIKSGNLKLKIGNANKDFYTQNPTQIPRMFNAWDSIINFRHKEQQTLDFDRDPLVPFSHSNEGPCISIADVNNDKLEDIFISGAKLQPSKLFFQQKNGTFSQAQAEVFDEDKISEDISHIFFDADNDQDLDLLVVSGGNEFLTGSALQPRLYLNTKGMLTRDTVQFKDIQINASKVVAEDIDNDGDQDICIVSNQVAGKFGDTPKQYIFTNDGHGAFSDITKSFASELASYGNIKDMLWKDLDQNGFPDLIVAGHWTPITIFLNDGKQLKKQQNNGLEHTNGWWNTIEMADLDQDGDLDILAGNWGLNTKFRATKEQPITLYRSDFDENGSIETLVTHYHGSKETAFASKDELAKQMPILNKKFLRYKDFAKATIQELFGRQKLENAQKKHVTLLTTSYFENDGKGSFSMKELPKIVQASSINDIFINDIDGDGHLDALLVGNNFEISTQLGRLDALHGLYLKNDGNGNLLWKENLNISGAARKIEQLTIKGKPHFVVTRNNDFPVFLVKN